MSEKLIKLDNLNEEEIKNLYELFFGKILMKRKGFSYKDNLTTLLSKDNIISSFLDKLNSQETEILKYLSKFKIISNVYLIEKLNIILDYPLFLINKIISNLILKNFIFQRNESLVIPQIFFQEHKIDLRINEVNENFIEYNSKAMVDVNNLINYFICMEFRFSNSLSLYKKDYLTTEDVFINYSILKDEQFNYVSYFFANAFCDEHQNLNLTQLKNFFNCSFLDRTLYLIEIIFPNIFSIVNYFYKQKKSVKISKEYMFYLWEKSLLLQNYKYAPIKVGFDDTISFLEKIEIIKTEEDGYIIKYYNSSIDSTENDIKISTNFNIFINANSAKSDLYIPSLFADLKNYNKIVEYEINENSVRRGVINGFTYDDFIEFLNQNCVELPKNVEATTNQWFEKHGSYYYSTGTLFFCNSKEKAKLILNLIEKNFIKAYEIKKDEVFIIPEEEKENFFKFLEKTGINFFYKEPQKKILSKKNDISDITRLLEDNI